MNPFHPHCGPFNKISEFKSSNRVDEICRQHDIGYGKLGKRAYTHFNQYDEEFIRAMEAEGSMEANAYAEIFRIKREIAPHLKSFRKTIDKEEMPYRKRYGRKRRSRSARRAYGRKYRRTRSNRRRALSSYRKKNKRVSFAKRVMSVVNNRVSEPHTWLSEDEQSHNLLAGKYHFIAPTCLFDRSDLATSWADTGEGGASLGGSTNNPAKCCLRSGFLRVHVRNLLEHPLRIQVYWLTAKQDIHDATSCINNVVDSLLDGWKDRMLAADETTANFLGGTQVTSTGSALLSPYHSSRLKDKWRIKKGKGGWLQPGDIVDFRYKLFKKRYLRYFDITSSDNRRTYRGLTVVPLFKVHTAIGHDTVNIDEALCLDGYVHMQMFKSITWTYVTTHVPLIAYSENKDTAFTTGGEGPTDVEMKQDE